MNLSPLQLDLPEYPVVSVKAMPSIGEARTNQPLPLEVDARVLFDKSGDHFAFLSIQQQDESWPYTLQIDVYAGFRIDVDGCRQAYKSAFNPEVVSVNVARILFSGAKEMLALVSSRSPYGTAKLPTLLIQPSDVNIGFEDGHLDEILVQSFGLDPDAVQEARRKTEATMALSASMDPEEKSPKPRTKKRTSKN